MEGETRDHSHPAGPAGVWAEKKAAANQTIPGGGARARAATATQPGVDKAVQTEFFAGDGSTVNFVLTYEPDWEGVYLSGMRQKVTDDYTITENTVTFVSAPKTGQKIVVDYIPA